MEKGRGTEYKPPFPPTSDHMPLAKPIRNPASTETWGLKSTDGSSSPEIECQEGHLLGSIPSMVMCAMEGKETGLGRGEEREQLSAHSHGQVQALNPGHQNLI